MKISTGESERAPRVIDIISDAFMWSSVQNRILLKYSTVKSYAIVVDVNSSREYMVFVNYTQLGPNRTNLWYITNVLVSLDVNKRLVIHFLMR